MDLLIVKYGPVFKTLKAEPGLKQHSVWVSIYTVVV